MDFKSNEMDGIIDATASNLLLACGDLKQRVVVDSGVDGPNPLDS